MHEGITKLTNDRYLWEWDIDGTTVKENMNMMLLRVAKKVASAWLSIKPKDYAGVTAKAHKFYDLMSTGMFMPSSPQLFNAMRGFGNGKKHYDIIYKDIAKMTNEEWDIIYSSNYPHIIHIHSIHNCCK